MKEIEFWKFIDEKLNTGCKVILMIVAESSKSSPGRAGFKMAISSDKALAGTIGGGIMEHKLLEECRQHFAADHKINSVKKLFHNKNSPGEKSGLICGGSETIIMKSIDKNDKDFVLEIITNCDNLKCGSLIIDQDGISIDESGIQSQKIIFNFKSDNEWSYKETTGQPNTVYVIGGGHVGLAVSKVLSTQDFFVITIDPRKDVFTMVKNVYANKKLYIPYADVGDHIIEGDRSFAVIVTSEHDTDLAALRSIINKKLKYIGLMGSKAKIKSIYNKLIELGIDPELLKKVHTPIGIEIEAESPDEIGISIAAEIIKVKNEKHARHINE
jgi:xanthine dehydrogenase accessory factor